MQLDIFTIQNTELTQLIIYFSVHSVIQKKIVNIKCCIVKHPEIVPKIKDFIEQNSAAAHLRRRNATAYTNGVTLQEIVNHVKSVLKIDVCRDQVHRLMNPPCLLYTSPSPRDRG